MRTREQLNRDATVKIVIGFLGSAACNAVDRIVDNTLVSILTWIPGLLFLALFCFGCADYAESKGYSRWWGLIGILGCCGLIILVLVPNKWVEASRPEDWPTNYPRA